MVRSNGLELVIVLKLYSTLPRLRLTRQYLLIGHYTYLQLQRHYSEDETTENQFRYVQSRINPTPNLSLPSRP